MWRIVAACALFLPAAALSQALTADSVPTITLPQALEAARTSNPALAAGEAGVRTARAARLAVTGEYLPTLGLASSAGRGTSIQGANAVTNGIPVPSTARALDDLYGTGIATSVPIYTGGRRGAEKRSAVALQTAADASMTAAQYDVRLSTKAAYFDALRAQELVDVAKAQVAEAQEAMLDAQRRLHAGTSTRSDVLRAQVTLSGAQDALATAVANADATQFALGRAIGSDGPAKPAPLSDTSVVRLAVPRDSIVAAALRSAPTARAANANASSASAEVGAARAQYYPEVLASGGYGWLEQRSINPRPVGGWTLQLGISYPAFNGFQREAGVMRAEAAANAAQSAAVDTERGVRVDAVRAYDQVNVAAERIGLARQAVQAATEDLRVQQARYRAGASTFLDELTSESALTQAQTSLVQARYDYQIARATLERVLGRELQ